MDISVYISELLFNHDCVIIPGFGGFICSYRPAEIHPVLHTLAPPSKAISFNKNLQTNDGLLIAYIANSLGLSFNDATDGVNAWVNSSKSLLRNKEELSLRKVGKFFNDIEGNLQFTPDESTNYLRSSFGLKTITAEPILRAKELETANTDTIERKISTGRSFWKIAAVIVLLVGIGAAIQMMWMGVEIKPLNLNEASVLSFVSHIFKSEEPEIKTIPVLVEKTAPVVETPTSVEPIPETTAPVNAANVAIPANNQHNTTSGYYIIVGAFAEEKNAIAAKENLLKKYSESDIIIEKGGRLTRLGYAVGTDAAKAKEQLRAAQAENESVWLLKK